MPNVCTPTRKTAASGVRHPRVQGAPAAPLKFGVALPRQAMYDPHTAALLQAFAAAGQHARRIELGETPQNIDVLLLASKGRSFEKLYRRIPPREKRTFRTLLWQWDPLPPPTLKPDQEVPWMKWGQFDWDQAPFWGSKLTAARLPAAAISHRCRELAIRTACHLGRVDTRVFENATVGQIYFCFSQWASIRRHVRDKHIDVVLASAICREHFLRDRGIPTAVLPIGYHEQMGRRLDLQRDIDVLFIGRVRRSRRASIIPDLETQLKERGGAPDLRPQELFR